MTQLCTIGYEKFTMESWLGALIAHEVTLVVDVRDLPISRKKGFSKTRLSDALAQAGVGYVHAKDLGNPKHLRDALRAGLDFAQFAQTFGTMLSTRRRSLHAVAQLLVDHRICLLCYEEDPGICHRSLVAERLIALAEHPIEMVHIRRADAA